MRILVVAPDVHLPWAEEEARYIVNTLGAKLAGGSDVSVRSIMDLAAGDDFDVLWFATHGGPDGIMLSQDVLTADILAQIARRCKAQLIFLNACASERVAEQIFAAVQVPIVCTIAETMDIAAYATGRMFAQDLAKGLDFRTAFRNSKTRTFRMIPEMSDNGSVGGAVREQVYRNRDRLWELATKVDSVIGIVNELRREETLRIEEHKEDRARVRTLLWAVGFLIFLVMVILMLNIYNFYTIQALLQDAL